MRNQQLAQCIDFLGGLEGLTGFMKAFYRMQKADLLIGFFFEQLDTDPIAQKQAAFFASACGRGVFTGSPPAKAHNHKKMAPILLGHFNRRLVLLEQCLTAFHVPLDLQKAWLGFERSFRKQIVSPVKTVK